MTSDPASSLPNIRGFLLEELQTWLETRGHKRYRALQIFKWIHSPVESFTQMTDLKKELREVLEQNFSLALPKLVTLQKSQDGTRKYLFAGEDNQSFEAVYIPEVATGSSTNTLCVSSQTGCAVGCTFCFTASIRKNRNLTAAEIIGQVHAVKRDLQLLGDSAKLKNIVFMGMGEPLLNYDHVVNACKLLTDENGLAFSWRRVTVSTAGIAPKMAQLGKDVAVQLALSLHAASNDLRDQIVPINRKWNVETIIQALKDFPKRNRQSFIIEYVILKDVNDSLDEAKKLTKLLKNIPCKINLLPLNPHEKTNHQTPDPKQVVAFQNILRAQGFNVFIRTARGQDIQAACGQLGGETEKLIQLLPAKEKQPEL